MKKKSFNFKDGFEMLYLRHDYLKRAGKLNGAFVTKYSGIVVTTAKIMFRKLTNFKKVGFTEEDVISITNMYMLSYMALYSIQTNPKEMQSLLTKRNISSLSDDEIVRIDRNHMINFLRQRLHHCGVLCARKARNIIVGSDRRGIFAETVSSSHVPDDVVLSEHKKYGFRKVMSKEYRAAVIKSKEKDSEDIIDSNGSKIFKVEMLNKGISEEEYKIITENNKSAFYQSPDVALEMVESDLAFDSFISRYETMNKEEKDKVLTSFIKKNRKNKTLKKEIRLAKKLLTVQDTVVL